MPANPSFEIGPLRESEVAEAVRIMRLAFGTFLGAPNPQEFMGDRDFLTPRFHSSHVKCVAARAEGRLVGTNVVTRWGSFGYFGPLTVLPEYWNRGVAQQLLQATIRIFDRWGVRHSGLYTFAASVKHVGLYQKFGYWPQYLTALMTRNPEGGQAETHATLSSMGRKERAAAVAACARLTDGISPGLDLTGEIRSGAGEVVIVPGKGGVDGFAVCLHGAGTEGGSETCYIKFGAARTGVSFDKLLAACEGFAAQRGISLEAGVNLALARAQAARRRDFDGESRCAPAAVRRR